MQELICAMERLYITSENEKSIETVFATITKIIVLLKKNEQIEKIGKKYLISFRINGHIMDLKRFENKCLDDVDNVINRYHQKEIKENLIILYKLQKHKKIITLLKKKYIPIDEYIKLFTSMRCLCNF